MVKSLDKKNEVRINKMEKKEIEQFNITWSKYLPSYDVSILKRRLEDYEFALATLLTPENLISCLDINYGRELFIKFYSNSFGYQRREMTKIIEETLNPPSTITQAINEVPAEEYVPKEKRELSYWNGVTWTKGLNGSTPPWLAALGATLLKIKPGMAVADVGFGNGYTGAIFSEAMQNDGTVYGIEIDEETIVRANKIAKKLGYNNIKIKKRDAFELWDKKRKFDAIWSGCAVKSIPPIWESQLEEDGRMVVFRPLTSKEWESAQKIGFGYWASRTSTYRQYFNYWWRDVCMEVLKKESKELIPVFRLYEMDNTPFYHPSYGSTINLDWRYEIGSNEEEKLLSALG